MCRCVGNQLSSPTNSDGKALNAQPAVLICFTDFAGPDDDKGEGAPQGQLLRARWLDESVRCRLRWPTSAF